VCVTGARSSVRFEVLTVKTVRSTTVRKVTPSSLVEILNERTVSIFVV
jgi:hypothetical protein